MCSKHYKRWKAHGDPRVRLNVAYVDQGPCTEAECNEIEIYAKGLCKRHYKNQWARDHPESRSAYDPVRMTNYLANLSPEVKRERGHREILRKHHVTQAWWDSTLSAQDNKCGTGCGSTDPGGYGRWCIDHDHQCCPGKMSCGKCVRGLICFGCNAGMGQMGDNADRLRICADYLDHHATLSLARRLLESPSYLCLF